MKKNILSIILGIFLLAAVGATVTQLTFNAPDDGEIGQTASQLVNITVYSNDTSNHVKT